MTNSEQGSVETENQGRFAIFEQLTPDEKQFMESQPSNSIKFIFMKFKCIIVLSVSLLAFFQFIYIIVKEIHASIETTVRMSEIIKLFFEQSNTVIPLQNSTNSTIR